MACEIHLETESRGASLKSGPLVFPTRHPETQNFSLEVALEKQHGGWQEVLRLEKVIGFGEGKRLSE